LEQECFYKSIRNGTPAIIDIVDAEKAMKIIDAVQTSLKENKVVEF